MNNKERKKGGRRERRGKGEKEGGKERKKGGRRERRGELT